MTWLKHPGKFRFLTFNISDLWVGAGTDAGKFAYKTTIGGTEKYVVTDGFVGFKLKVSGTVLNPVFSDVNGSLYFQGGNFILHKSSNDNWILMESESWRYAPIPPGYNPVEWWNYEVRETEGDGWWLGRLSTQNTMEFLPKGTVEGNKTVEFFMPRWEKTKDERGETYNLTRSVLGTYADPEELEDEVVVGVRRWRDNTGKY